MKNLLGVALALLFATPVLADEISLYPKPSGYGAVWGDVAGLSSAATNKEMAWGFESQSVDICTNPNRVADVYWRMGTTLSDSPGEARASQDAARNTVVATTNAIFQYGNGTNSPGIAAGGAPIMPVVFALSQTATPSGYQQICRTFPIRANGIIVHSTGTASVWVTAFGEGRSN